MKPSRQQALSPILLALACAAAIAPVQAQQSPEVAALAKPDTASLSAGIVAGSGTEKDRTIFGQYNGLRKDDVNWLLDFDLVNRDDATGLWTTIRGRNLGLDSREVGLAVQRQGDWRFGVDYSELVHHEIRTINTDMKNPGSTTPEIVRLGTPGTGTNWDLNLKRTNLGLSGDKWISSNMQFELTFKNEDKDGARLWARGYDCASYVCTTTQNATNTRWALIPVPEPVNFNTKQVEAKFNFTGEKFLLSAGYYGSFFSNTNGTVNPTVPTQLNGSLGQSATLNPAAAAGQFPTGGTSLRNVLQTPMALYPDNQAHQLYVSGNYAFTKATRSTFKLAYTHATQDEDFLSAGLTGAPAGRSNLGGVLDTTLAQFGISSRLTPKLSVVGDVRYEKRDDKTPIATYNVEDTTTWNNSHITNERTTAKGEASYQFPAATRGTVGIDYEQVKRELPDAATVEVAGISGLRGETEEITYRAELRRSLSETLTGSILLGHSERTGSDWYNLCTSAACVAQGLTYGGLYSYSAIYQRTGVFAYNVADRKRDKAKVTADWTPTERLTLQFVGEYGDDTYDPPSGSGLSKGGMDLVSLDAAYAFSEKWKLTVYGSLGHQTMKEADLANYIAETNNRSTAAGLKVDGKVSPVLDVGAGVTYVEDLTEYKLSPDTAATPPPSAANVNQNALGLPNVKFSQTWFSFYAKFAATPQTDIRLDLWHVIAKLDEWSWGYNGIPFTYSDNTTVTLNPNQEVTFLGARVISRFK
jgi:MtrB/PioB family decaheme-associated outer membrane protein